jgi:hypothetical protein
MFGVFLGDFCISAFMNYQGLKRLSAVLAMPRTQASPSFVVTTP